ncbi:DUF4249 domain-containing protein [Pseudochryseolinea flava]|uniref:DUF4249 domain-containing protein n=1 Tax=Pseudochryseolinea flava TaxID=2059302 RepID=A0A364XW97_9BACT|nr:DUF4249 domain-containing protein [Pseudochryseolinea flava]RAV98608.1 hypothetical protein DQQ10_23015 [Pseudochryseolinea flava]
MKSITYILSAIIGAAALSGCQETVQLDLKQTPPKVVIEGQVTNHPGYQSVKISRSVDFYSSGQSPRITNATVIVTDSDGNEIEFVHNPNNHPDSAGVYIPSPSFVGEIGKTYSLRVSVGSEIFEASDKMVSVIDMDSLKYRINEDEREDPKTDGKFYELLMYAKEPQNESNFYLFKFYRNDSLTTYGDTDIYYSDDKYLAENIDGVTSPIYYAPQDKGKVEMYSLSRVGYVFFNDLSTLLNNDGGGMFGPIPSTPRTNLTNGALGFFQVSAVNSIEITVEE